MPSCMVSEMKENEMLTMMRYEDVMAADAPAPKKNLTAYCTSHQCISEHYRQRDENRIRDSDKVRKNVNNKRATKCPDCGYALFWLEKGQK